MEIIHKGSCGDGNVSKYMSIKEIFRVMDSQLMESKRRCGSESWVQILFYDDISQSRELREGF